MTDVSWLDTRCPSPPEELRVRLEGDMVSGGREGMFERLIGAAVISLQKALARTSRDRAAAFDLLVADAWLTYASEVALEGEEPDVALERLVSLGSGE